MSDSSTGNAALIVNAPDEPTIKALHDSVLSILNAGRGDEVTMKALDTLSGSLANNTINITDNHFTHNQARPLWYTKDAE